MTPKVTLISPYNNVFSYGIRSLSTYLRSKNINVSVIYLINNFNTPYASTVLNQLIPLCQDSTLIGISCMSNYFPNCIQLTQMLKAHLKTPIVFGGPHATVAPDECLQFCDIAVVDEGEQTLLDIVTRMNQGKTVEHVPGTIFKKNGALHKNALRVPMRPEDMPIIDNDFSSDYILVNKKICSIDYSLAKRFVCSDYITLSSFGCPFSCSYCINNKLKTLHGNKVRFRLLEHIIEELGIVKNKMPFVKHISFDDDAFMMRTVEEIQMFAEAYKDKIGLPFFVSGVNPMFVTEEKMKILIDAGMDRVRMGIQSGSAKSKDILNRHISNDKVIDAAHIIHKFRRQLKLTAYDLILDNPFESSEDIIQTIHLLDTLPAPFTLNLFSLTFFPGTDLHQKAVSSGVITDKVKDIYNKHYLLIKPAYLNFVILLYTVCKIPSGILRLLLKDSLVKRVLTIPGIIFKLVILIGYIRRGMDLLWKGDPYTLSRHLKVIVFK